MEFRFGGFNEIHGSPSSSSSSIYTSLTYQAPEEGLWRRNVSDGGRSERLREFEKQMIREEILSEEAHRRRVLEAEVRTELMMEREMMRMQGRRPENASSPVPQSHHNRFHPAVIHGETGRLLVVDLRRRSQSPEIEKEMIGLGKPYSSTPSGVKRKRRSQVVGGSTELCYRSKKTADDLSCALCKVRTTCESGFEEHLAGKKHRAKAAGLRGNKKAVSKGTRHLKKIQKSGRKSGGKSGAR